MEEELSFSEQQRINVEHSEHLLRNLVKGYKTLKTLHERFVRETEDSCLDFAGPELQRAMQLSFHKRLAWIALRLKNHKPRNRQ